MIPLTYFSIVFLQQRFFWFNFQAEQIYHQKLALACWSNSLQITLWYLSRQTFFPNPLYFSLYLPKLMRYLWYSTIITHLWLWQGTKQPSSLPSVSGTKLTLPPYGFKVSAWTFFIFPSLAMNYPGAVQVWIRKGETCSSSRLLSLPVRWKVIEDACL